MTEPPAEVNAVSLIMMVTCVREDCSAIVLLLPGDLAATLRNRIYKSSDGFLRAFESYSSYKTRSKAQFFWSEGGDRMTQSDVMNRLRADARRVFQEQADRLRSDGWTSGAPDQDHGWSVQVFTRTD